MSRFNLPVLKGGGALTAEEMLRRSLHAEGIYNAAMGEELRLNAGIAIVSEDLPEVDMANEVRDATVPEGTSPEQVIAEVDDAFARRKLRCLAWTFEEGRIDARVAALLEPRGYRRMAAQVWALQQPKFNQMRGDLTIIPARASYEKIRQIFLATGHAMGDQPGSRVAQYAEAGVRVLDDHRIDGLLALDGDLPAGVVYLVTAGESGFIADLYVHPERKNQRIGTTLLERTVELASRSQHRSLTLFCRKTNAAASHLYQATGFVQIGEVASMRLV